MIGSRALLVALAGAGLTLQGCASKPPPAPPAPVVQAPPPNFTGTYSGNVTWSKGCRGPKTATLTVQGTTYTLPWNKVSFTGPVAEDGSFNGHIPASAPPAKQHSAGSLAGIDLLNGKIAGNSATAEVHLIKCVGTLDLTKQG